MAAESGIQIEALGHRDKETEGKEKALEQLSSLPSSSAGQLPPKASASSQQSKFQQQAVPDSYHQTMPSDMNSQASSLLQVAQQSADPGQFSQAETAAASPSSGERQQSSMHDASPSASTAGDIDHQQREASEQMAGEVYGPITDAAPPSNDYQDGSAAYLENAMGAVNVLLSSSSQQTAILGLSTLLTILKVEQSPADDLNIIGKSCLPQSNTFD